LHSPQLSHCGSKMTIADDLIEAAKTGDLEAATRLSDEMLAAKQDLNSTDGVSILE
jgi:hypothetical protein